MQWLEVQSEILLAQGEIMLWGIIGNWDDVGNMEIFVIKKLVENLAGKKKVPTFASLLRQRWLPETPEGVQLF